MGRNRRLAGQDGTTLVELLVVIALLSIVGSVTTIGIVTSFRTQLVATRDAESLDELRLSVQRMRDDIRGADEVCASSDGDTLAIWTDREGIGVLGDDENVEVTIFEVDETTSQLTRRVRGSATSTLISDVIVTPGGDVFLYDVAPTAQEADLVCDTGLVTSPSTAATSRVTFDIDVQNSDGVNTVSTLTAVRVRNAGLSDVTSGGGAGSTNGPPTAEVNIPGSYQCTVDVQCPLDGVGTDPESGTLTYAWDFNGDGTFDDADDNLIGDAGVEDPSPVFSTTGPVLVALRVTDDQSQSATATGTVDVIASDANQAPVAAFNFNCTAGTCEFDAWTESYANDSEPTGPVTTDAEDGLTDLDFEWTFAPVGGTAETTTDNSPTQVKSFSAASVDVTLLVTDSEGLWSESSERVSTAANTIRVASLRAVGGPQEGSGKDKSFTATLTVEVTTTSGIARDDVQVTVAIANARDSVGTCNTGDNGIAGKCDVVVTADHNSKVTFTVDTLDDSAGAPYAPNAGVNEPITVSKSSIVTLPEA